MPKSKIILTAFSLVAFFSACAEPQPQAPAPQYTTVDDTAFGSVGIVIKMPTEAARHRYISARVLRLPESGAHRGYPVNVDLNVEMTDSYTRHNTFLSPIDQATAEEFASTYDAEQSSDLAYRMAVQVASQSECQGKRITENTYSRGYRGEQIAEIAAANNGHVMARNVRVPEGTISTPVTVIELTRWGWKVALWCQ
jgi:hypothetical protein